MAASRWREYEPFVGAGLLSRLAEPSAGEREPWDTTVGRGGSWRTVGAFGRHASHLPVGEVPATAATGDGGLAISVNSWMPVTAPAGGSGKKG